MSKKIRLIALVLSMALVVGMMAGQTYKINFDLFIQENCFC